MRIVTADSTYEEFVASEIREYGHDWVEAQFLLGYEPLLVRGIWAWHKSDTLTLISPPNDTSTISRKRT